MSDDERDWRAPDATRMTFDEMAARAQYEWDRAEKAEAEAANYAARIEALEAENARLGEVERLLNDMESLKNTYRADCLLAEARTENAESALNREQDNVYASFDKWSKALGWGLTGNQPECWALMDAAVEELISKRSALAEAVEVMRPFAREAANYDPDEGDGPETSWCRLDMTIGHLRAARAFVQQHEGEK